MTTLSTNAGLGRRPESPEATPNLGASRSRQRGVTLAMVLVFLLILSGLGVATMYNLNVEERMARNLRDYTVAFQAAEAALRDGFLDICTIREPMDIGYDCGNGICQPAPSGSPPIWETLSLSGSPSVAYGTYTGALALSGVSAQPRYLIELIRQPSGDLGNNYDSKYLYRITARGYGRDAATRVTLQQTVRPPC